MKTVYLDSDFMCHITRDGTMIEVQTDALNGFCDNAVELIRFVPQGTTYSRPDGRIIHGEFIQITDSAKVDAYQKQYMEDQEKMEDMTTALAILGVTE